MRTLLPALAIVLGSATAHAGDIGVVVTGEATLQPQLAAQLEGWLREHGHPLAASPLPPDAINTLIDCFVIEDLSCARSVIDKRAKAQAVVFAKVEVTPSSSGTRDIAITGYWFQKDHEAIAERRMCTACTDEKLHATADDLMQALAAEPPVGTTKPTPVPMPAPAPEPASLSEQPEGSRLLPMTLIGVGAASLVIGGVMIAIDEDPTKQGVQQPNYRDTATGGVVLAVAGAAALGTGLYLWLHHGSRSAPVAAVTHDGAIVGWTGRF